LPTVAVAADFVGAAECFAADAEGPVGSPGGQLLRRRLHRCWVRFGASEVVAAVAVVVVVVVVVVEEVAAEEE
jgi:hypothetical protein